MSDCQRWLNLFWLRYVKYRKVRKYVWVHGVKRPVALFFMLIFLSRGPPIGKARVNRLAEKLI